MVVKLVQSFGKDAVESLMESKTGRKFSHWEAISSSSRAIADCCRTYRLHPEDWGLEQQKQKLLLQLRQEGVLDRPRKLLPRSQNIS